MRRAARRGDGWMPYLVSADAYARSVATVRAEAEAAGRDLAGFEWMLYLYCSVRADGDRARDDVASFLGRAYGDKPGAMLDRIAPAGTPEEVAAKLQPYVDAGARHIVDLPGGPRPTRSRSCGWRPRRSCPGWRCRHDDRRRDCADGEAMAPTQRRPCSGRPSTARGTSAGRMTASTGSGSSRWRRGSDLGLGHAGGVPGRLLADLGASVTRIVGATAPAIDADVPWGRVWHRGQAGRRHRRRRRGRGTTCATPTWRSSTAARRSSRTAAWAGTTSRAANPSLVYARCRPSRTAAGEVDDFALLVEARAGFCTQLAAHRPGPMLVDVRASATGAAFLLTTSALALLRRRALTGAGGWAETSLYDGMLATLGCMIGRSERAAPKIESYWAEGSFFPNFLYRCGDGELLQIWFGGKGMYDKVIEVLGDEPSTDGYYAEQMSGLLQARAERWHDDLPVPSRATSWIERLRAAGVACEPVLGPGEALADPHLAEIGLAVRADGPPTADPTTRRRAARPTDDVVLGSAIDVTPDSATRRGAPRRRRRPVPACSRACGSSTSRRSWPGRWRPRCWPTSAPTSSRSSRRPARRCGPRPTPSPPASGASAASPSTSPTRRPGPSSRRCCARPTSCCTTSASAWPSGSASTPTRSRP